MRSVVQQWGAALAVLATLLANAPSRASAQASARVVMTTSQGAIAVGQSFQLQIRVEVTGADAENIQVPELSAFSVVRRSVSQPMSMRFGFGQRTQVIQSTTIYSYTLRPLREGRFEISPTKVTVAGRLHQSNALVIDVRAAGAAGIGGAPNIGVAPGQNPAAPPSSVPPAGVLDGATFDGTAFIRTVVDNPNPYVGQQVTVTVYLYARGGVRSSPTVTREATADGFWVRDLLPRNRTLDGAHQTVNGTPFRVYVMRRFAAFALREGELSIGAPEMQITTGSLFDIFQAPSNLTRVGVPVAITARAHPAPAPRDALVGSFEVHGSVDRSAARTGDAVTFTVRIDGTGNVRDFRPELPAIDGLRTLAPRVDDSIDHPDDLVIGTRTMEWLILVDRPGTFTLPALGADVLDPETGTYRRIETTPIAITATGAAVADPGGTAIDEQPGTASTGSPEHDITFQPVHTRSELDRGAGSITASNWFPWVLSLPPLLFFALVGFGVLRRKAASKAAAGAPKRASKSARKALARAEQLAADDDARGFYSEVARALKGVLEARLGEPIGGMTHLELGQHLEARGMDSELRREVVEEVEGAEFARFSASGHAPAEMQRTVERANGILRRLDQFAPTGEAS